MKTKLIVLLIVGVCIVIANWSMAAPLKDYSSETDTPVVQATFTGNAVTGCGLYGQTDSPVAYSSGVYGWAAAAEGTTYGVYGGSFSSAGYGVYGKGYTAIYGEAYNVPNTIGVKGSGETGVSGEGSSVGVKGESSEDGVLGRGFFGVGVKGKLFADDPNVFGELLDLYGALSELTPLVTEEGFSFQLSAVHGYVPNIDPKFWPPEFPTIGVYAENYQPNGYAVKGVSADPTSYAGYFENTSGENALGAVGNVRITGNVIVAGDLTVTGAIPEPVNLALLATATASSEKSDAYSAKKINDGIYGQWDAGEWASDSEKGAIPAKKDENGNEIPGTAKDGPWIQLNWFNADGSENPQTFNLTRIWSRPNKCDQILDSYLILVYSTVSGKPQIKKHLGMIPAGGLCKEVPLTVSEGENVIIFHVYIPEVIPETMNTGLAEIQCINK